MLPEPSETQLVLQRPQDFLSALVLQEAFTLHCIPSPEGLKKLGIISHTWEQEFLTLRCREPKGTSHLLTLPFIPRGVHMDHPISAPPPFISINHLPSGPFISGVHFTINPRLPTSTVRVPSHLLAAGHYGWKESSHY